jgi:hypothetical protein
MQCGHPPQVEKISFGWKPSSQALQSAAVRVPSCATGRVPGHWLQDACLVAELVRPYQPDAHTAQRR